MTYTPDDVARLVEAAERAIRDDGDVDGCTDGLDAALAPFRAKPEPYPDPEEFVKVEAQPGGTIARRYVDREHHARDQAVLRAAHELEVDMRGRCEVAEKDSALGRLLVATRARRCPPAKPEPALAVRLGRIIDNIDCDRPVTGAAILEALRAARDRIVEFGDRRAEELVRAGRLLDQLRAAEARVEELEARFEEARKRPGAIWLEDDQRVIGAEEDAVLGAAGVWARAKMPPLSVQERLSPAGRALFDAAMKAGLVP